MRRHLSQFVLLAFVMLAAGIAEAAVQVQVTYTGDNVIGAFFQDGAAAVSIGLGVNAGDWQNADTAVLNLAAGDDYQLIFRVNNVGGVGDGNPAAFLAEISGAATGDLLTSVNWEYALDGGSTPTDFDTLSWNAATEYGTNGVGNIWATVRSGGSAVPGISTSANWIWSEINFAEFDDSDENQLHQNLWIRAQISTPVVIPEPATIVIWSLLGAMGLIATRRRRKRHTS